MKPFSFRIAVTTCALAAFVPLAFFTPFASSQIQAGPVYAPIGVAAAGNTSMAWFHDTASGRAVACRALPAVGGGLPSIECVAAKLP